MAARCPHRGFTVGPDPDGHLDARISEQGDAGIANVVGTYDFATEAVRLRRVRPSNPEEEHQASQANPEEENPEAEEGRRVRPRR